MNIIITTARLQNYLNELLLSLVELNFIIKET